MVKKINIFSCVSCGYESNKWLGKCPSCNEWNSFVEDAKFKGKHAAGEYRNFGETGVMALPEIILSEEERIKTGIIEADRVFGGGIVKGSIVLLGGEPGIGKSTLALMLAGKTAEQGCKVLYISGEESLAQIKMRADRLKISSNNIFLVTETAVEKIAALIEKEKPALVIIDSIQTVYKDGVDSVAGSFTQVRESGAHLLYTAKKTGVPIILIGHVTKDGMIAGPKTLEHMVDAVIYFESEKYLQFRILRAEKNRFGSTNEIGIFEMTDEGLKEVKSPSKMLLENLADEKTGSSIVTVMEGTRALMLEIQALTGRRAYGTPQRTVTGIDYNRFLLILAIMERKIELSLESQDIFVNVAGGIKVNETAADLAVAAAIYSSFTERPVSTKTVFMGELGLDGEVRQVKHLDLRIQEAQRLGFNKCVIPAKSKPGKTEMNIVMIKDIREIAGIIRQ
ncbi:MAG: DNA repair protein RadA [bacterium]